MECNEIKSLLSDYLEGSLSEEQKLDIEKHLGICKDCSAELEGLRRIISELNKMKKIPPPGDLLEGIQRNLGIPLKKEPFLRRMKIPLEAVGVLVSVVFVVYIAIQLNQVGSLRQTKEKVELGHPEKREEVATITVEGAALKDNLNVARTTTVGQFSTSASEGNLREYYLSSDKAPMTWGATFGYQSSKELDIQALSTEKAKTALVKSGYDAKMIKPDSLQVPAVRNLAEQKITLISSNLSEDNLKIKSVIKEIDGRVEKEGPRNIYVRIPSESIHLLITKLEAVAKIILNVSPSQEGFILINIELTEQQ
jgi:hypothetical protein